MTEQERIRDDDASQDGMVYDTPTETMAVRESMVSAVTPQHGTDTVVMLPIDRVRWSAVIAGLFAALSTLAVLSVLGLAIGFSSSNPGDLARSFGIEADVWGAISVLIAFVVGGWVAARTAAVSGRANGTLNGVMVWVVTIPLLLSLLGSSLGALVTIADGVVATGAQVAAPLVEQLTNQAVPQAPTNQVTPGNNVDIVAAAGAATWGVLLSLLLGLIAAAFGGLLGARSFTDLAATLPLVRTHHR